MQFSVMARTPLFGGVYLSAEGDSQRILSPDIAAGQSRSSSSSSCSNNNNKKNSFLELIVTKVMLKAVLSTTKLSSGEPIST